MDSKHKNELIRSTYKQFSDKRKTEFSNEFKVKKPMDKNKQTHFTYHDELYLSDTLLSILSIFIKEYSGKKKQKRLLLKYFLKFK